MEESGKNGKAKRGGASRGLRYIWGANLVVALGLSALLLAMANHLAYRHLNLRWDISSRSVFTLSPKTLNLLESLEGDIRLVAFFQSSHPFYTDVRNLLEQYRYAASRIPSLHFALEFVDPDRDLARARELVRHYGVDEPNVVVIEAAGRRKYIGVKEIVQSEIRLEGKGAVKTPTAFRGEQAFSSAIQSVTQAAAPVAYFLSGHGERDPEDFNKFKGYSRVGISMSRDNMEVRKLMLAATQGVPRDCSVLVIAGPDRPIPAAEVDAIAEYLNRKGRVLYLADAGTEPGLGKLMAEWGVEVGREVVVGLTLTGRELVVTDYADHPITRSLRQVTTILYRPRRVEAAAGAAAADSAADRPTVTVLATGSAEGWSEVDLAQMPPKFDKGIDHAGAGGVAVAVEKGAGGGIDVELKSTRLVVIGDSDFVSNGALASGGSGNLDLYLSALNWLLEREALIAIAPRAPGLIRLDMDESRIRMALAIFGLGLPALSALLGVAVWVRRRR